MTVAEQAGQVQEVRRVGDGPAGHNPFAGLIPITPEYASRPIDEGFNWAQCVAAIEEGEWYLVVFRSVRRRSADEAVLTAYDDRAFDEATRAPGFLFYFKGSLTERGECLSFCLWDRLYQAKIAARYSAHIAATQIVDQMYESYRLERYVVMKSPNVESGRLLFLPLA